MARKKQDILADEHTRDELYDMADRLDIPGRSTMNKAELAEAVVLAGGVPDPGTAEGEGAPPVIKAFAITTKETDYAGRALVNPGVDALDYLGRHTTATVDHLGRLLLDA